MSTDSTGNGYDAVAKKMQHHADQLTDVDRHVAMAQNAKPTGRYARRDHNETVAGIGRRAAQHLHQYRALETASKELSPEAIRHFGDAIQHDSLEDALKALPANHRSGPVGVHVRTYLAPAGPLGHNLSDSDQKALDDILNEVAVGTQKMGSSSKGANTDSTGKQNDAGIQGKGTPTSSNLHTAPAPSRKAPPRLFRNASDELRSAMDQAFRSSK